MKHVHTLVSPPYWQYDHLEISTALHFGVRKGADDSVTIAKVMWDFNTGKIAGLLDWQLSMVGPASMWNDGDFLSSNDFSGNRDEELSNMMVDF